MKEKHMNIVLKQPEIESALRMYMERQGISLANKTLAIAFTSGRGSNGVSAELTIEDVTIPGFEKADPAITTQELPKSDTPTAEASTVIGNGVLAEAAEALLVPSDIPAQAAVLTAAAVAPIAEAKVAQAEVAEIAQATVDAEAAPAKATTSLFGS